MSKKFLTYDSSNSPSEIRQCLDEYLEYLGRMKGEFPSHALEFAAAAWHWDGSDPRCPHDAWLESFEMKEESIEPAGSKRNLLVKAKFLGAYHDGTFTITYHGVQKYILNKEPLEFPVNMGSGHGDWQLDEVYLDDDNVVVHDIEFSNNGRWTIYCGDIEYEWFPFGNSESIESGLVPGQSDLPEALGEG